MDNAANLVALPDDSQALKAMLRTLIEERDQEKRRADQETRRSDELRVEMLRLQFELERYKKWYYGPRADRLQSPADLAQLLLNFAEEMDRKPINQDDVPSRSEPAEELRRVKRRKGRRNLANFENLPVTTCVHELNAAERACPCCGIERKEIGTEESWQVEYLPGHFERIHHLRKKYACTGCERNGNNPQMETAAKPEMAIDKGMAGPGLLAYIATSKFSDYVPLYRLEDIFERQGFEISRATQSVWCGDMADLAQPLWELMAERVRASHVVATDDTIMPMLSKGKTTNARMWVYVGDDDYPYNVFDFSVRGKAVFEMRADLSQPGGRIRLQTSPNCGGQEPSWETSDVKGTARLCQVRGGKTNESEPLMKCRENISDVKTGEMKLPQDQRRRCLFTADVTSGIEAASARSGLKHGTSEPVVPMQREKSKRSTRKDQSTDAGHRGGTTRSSDEGRVMRSERRGRIIHLSSNGSTAVAGGAHA